VGNTIEGGFSMKKSKGFVLGILVLVFGMVVIGAKPFDLIKPIMPDENSAVIYFMGGKGYGDVWDGDRPVGSFDAKKVPMIIPWIAYKATPGEHYFIINASNWIVVRADLEPGKRYFLKITEVPTIAFLTVVAVYPIGGDAGEATLNHKSTKLLHFSDQWRADFLKKDKKGKLLKEVREKLQEAQDKQMDIDLPREFGI
jgi:hypothetical protein